MSNAPHPEAPGESAGQKPSRGAETPSLDAVSLDAVSFDAVSFEAVGIALVGVGLGLQASSLFRLATRVGLGTPADDYLFGATGVLLIGLGALLFGGLARTKSFAGWNVSCLLYTSPSPRDRG